MKCNYLKKIVPFVKEKYGEKADGIMEAAWKRYQEILDENPNEPKLVAMHTRDRIYPGIAMFDALTGAGAERDEAAKFLIDYYRWRSEKAAKYVKALVSLPGMYKKFPAIFTIGTKKMFGEKSGFKARFYDVPKNEMRIDMIQCPYYENCKKYGCPEIVAAYCDADDACYAHMHPKLIWGRTKTIGKGGDCCDFKITAVD